jgi:hypothetical protein
MMALSASSALVLLASSAMLALVASVDSLLVQGKRCDTPTTMMHYKIIL